MEKLNKVIAALEACNGVGEDCNSCPYAGESEKCSGILYADALALLKEYRKCLDGCGIRQYGMENRPMPNDYGEYPPEFPREGM